MHSANPYYYCLFEFIGPMDELSDSAFPEYVYRYFDKEEYADALVNDGVIRLGSLLKYADDEAYDDKRLDRDEGKAGFLSKIKDGPYAGVPYQYKVVSQDCWILCTSKERSREVALKFGEFCVRVKVVPFALALARAMAILSDVGGAGAVRYSSFAGGDSIVSPDRAQVPFARMHKRRTYSAEKELRIWFEPRHHRDANRQIELFGKNDAATSTRVDHTFMTSNELPRYCKRVSVH